MKKVFKEQMFWIVGLIFLSAKISMQFIPVGTWNLNRTIGWGWDITDMLWWSSLSLSIYLPVFTIGYGILYFQKKSTHLALSIVHVLLIVSTFFVPVFAIMGNIILAGLSFMVFLINFIISVRRPGYDA